MTEVIMPKMGDGMEEGTLLEWLKKDGEKVKSGEVIGTIQTDKATIELESPGTGILTGFLLKGGETIPVGRPIAAILRDGETLPVGWGLGGAATTSTGAPAPTHEAPTTTVTVAAPVAESVGRVKVSPLAKKIAAEKGIDLAAVKGSGPGGRIVEKDVLSAESAPVASTPAPIAPVALPNVAVTAEDEVVPLNRMRQITGKRTQESKQQVPHFYVTVEVDVEKILALRAMFEEEESGKVSINDFVVKACTLALRDMPEVNAIFQGTTVLQQGAVHIGIAVAVPDGLTVPVIKNANTMTLRQLSTKAKELAKKAKENKLGMDELTGSTFSISNMGMLDVDNFIAIVNQPNSAILAIASVRKKVVATDEDEVEIRSRMNITCSFDHRVVDGAIGAKFINVVKAYLENPTRLMA
ncbi:MAG: dihydrolipoamide acetyltransferase family protein [Fimbriimonas sp.]|nr:dihydrolipoamide acetyltransferase family protein [Fimbriimonas sp.]